MWVIMTVYMGGKEKITLVYWCSVEACFLFIPLQMLYVLSGPKECKYGSNTSLSVISCCFTTFLSLIIVSVFLSPAH